MFDFSFYELVVFAVIALIVLGPEKLPQAVRTAASITPSFVAPSAPFEPKWKPSWI